MKTFFVILIPAMLVLAALKAEAQIVNPQKVLEKKVVNRVNRNIDKGLDKGLDAIEKGIKDEGKKKDGETPKGGDQQKQDKGNQPKANDNPVPPKSKESGQTTLQAFSKYDFVPGDQVLLYEDFSQDALGDFPALWTTDKSGEINTLNLAQGHWLNLNATEGNWWFMKDIDFPKNFIIEMDVVPKNTPARYALGIMLFGEDKHSEMDNQPYKGNGGLVINLSKNNWETEGYKKGAAEKLHGSSEINPVIAENVNHVIIWVQNRRVRIYSRGAKVLDMPTNLFEDTRLSRLCFRLYRGASCGSYVSNIKITTASPDLRSKLLNEGKWVSYGIYFDVNKDVVKPESYGSLKLIADLLKENTDLRIKVVGHTDSDGADAANLDLSKRRGAAVKNELIATFGIEAARLESDGMGENQPIAPNDTPVNKALNRRVEFLKL